MLPPGGRLAGSAFAVTEKALFEVLNCAISAGDVPWFVIDTFRKTGDPTFTSPKSTVAGLTTSPGVLEFVDDNALASAPQPESPKMSPVAAAPTAMAMAQPAIRPLELFSLWREFG